MFENWRKCGIIKIENGKMLLQYQNKSIVLSVGEVTDLKLIKRWGRDGRAGGIWGIPVEIASNFYGYQVIVSTEKRKYYVNSVDIGFDEHEEKTRQEAEEFAENYLKIQKKILGCV